MPNGTPVTGSTFRAQLYAGPTPNKLQPVSTAQPFWTSEYGSAQAGGGVFFPTVAIMPNARAGHYVFSKIRVWDSASGNNYETARSNKGLTGVSKLVRVLAGSEETGPMPLLGIHSFRLHRGD